MPRVPCSGLYRDVEPFLVVDPEPWSHRQKGTCSAISQDTKSLRFQTDFNRLVANSDSPGEQDQRPSRLD